ncbi:MAG: NACHT domain-containing protein [Symploca sp. SIO2E9]|nr:NACHT domain-containing protein [Symploca sp. SIO2E9]
MWEWLAAATGVELGKLVLEQVLNLGKATLEDYVKDFFKDCIQTGVARANIEVLKKPMAEAIGFFIKRFIKELQINDIPETSIEHHYKATIKRFVKDKTVGPILGKAFEKDCRQIDYAQLQRIWTQQYQDRGWQFPAEEFGWRGVAKEYVYEVKGIIKANVELRPLLETQLLEDIARNTAKISPGFDIAKYRDSLQCSYGYLKLYTLDSTDRVDAIKLWNMFIEQTVREALPPMRYDLPLDLKRQLQEQGQLEDDLSPEALEHYRYEYFQKPSQKVLEAVEDSQHAVILGDPGAGKSTLLQYLALDWVEGKTEALPLLIELREYTIAKVNSFLEFLHCGRGADWQFDQQQLHEHLLEHQTLVMFDGLDEVFDRLTQSTIIDDIIRFSQQYPQARVLVTSRIIGYNPERFQHAKFRQFTIQPLDDEEIQEFINRWYDLAMGTDFDRERLKQRLQDAIANSKAIQNLADNPLLLTMMAILNRRQELPRNCADLYDQASRVLLYHWDVDHKRLQLPMDVIGRREKQEMLRLIAYEMQAGEEGLKGNLISAERLTRILTDYLREQGFSEPREKANRLIQQLRERNFILCYRGADTYGFVHRTFLEYFCAVEIVNRFEKQQTLSFEQLRDEVFGQHWQDETWHEVLRLICGAIDAKFAGELIEFLMSRELELKQVESSKTPFHTFGEYCIDEKRIKNLLIAADCLTEVSSRQAICDIADNLLLIFQTEIEDEFVFPYFLTEEAALKVTHAIARSWSEDAQVLEWLKSCAHKGTEQSCIPYCAIKSIFQYCKHDSATLYWLKTLVTESKNGPLNAVDAVVKITAIENIAKGWSDSETIYFWILSLTKSEDWAERLGAVKALALGWKNNEETLEILKFHVVEDIDWRVRGNAIRTLAEFYIHKPAILELLSKVAVRDPFVRESRGQFNSRHIALINIVTHYPTNPKTLELLRDRATNDPDEQLREWATEQLNKMES